jgi:hypothetical protein
LLNKKQVEIIANYLYQNFGFNSTFALGFDGKQETLFWNSKNKYQVYFRAYKYSDIYWDGIKIDFSGQNRDQFYNLIGAKQVNWKIFNHEKSLRLACLDLCYTCKKTDNNLNIESVFKQCYQKVVENKAIKNFSLQKSPIGWILKIGKRVSPNYSRVYEKNRQIRFELEQRGSKIKLAQKLIMEQQIQNFEQIMTETFFKYSKKVLGIDENYLDWLIDYFRRQTQNQTGKSLVTAYFSIVSSNLNHIHQIFF